MQIKRCKPDYRLMFVDALDTLLFILPITPTQNIIHVLLSLVLTLRKTKKKKPNNNKLSTKKLLYVRAYICLWICFCRYVYQGRVISKRRFFMRKVNLRTYYSYNNAWSNFSKRTLKLFINKRGSELDWTI